MNKHIRVSLVIPAWNEERHLAECLQAIAAQTIMPDEVIVVDNNSTDSTVQIAASFPFVKLLHQTAEQGLIPTRNFGFAHARGDILARIDADAILEKHWIERVIADFADDQLLGGVTGFARTALLEHSTKQTTVWTRLYFIWGLATFRMHVLWGANMALRRKTWEQIKPQAALHDVEAHEDIDLSILTAAAGWRTLQDTSLYIEKDGVEYHKWPKLKAYTARRIDTYQRHQKLGSFTRGGARFRPAWKSWLIYAALLLPAFVFYGTSIVAYYVSNIVRKAASGAR